MPKIRNILPHKDSDIGAGRALRPFPQGMEEFFDNYFPRRWMESFMDPYSFKRPLWSDFGETFEAAPKIDVVDKDDALVIRAEMPGVKKEDLEITIAGDRLTFEAKRDFEREEKDDDFFRSEMSAGRVFRTIQLPVEIMGDEAKAELKDGIVEVYLPKVEATTPFKIKVA